MHFRQIATPLTAAAFAAGHAHAGEDVDFQFSGFGSLAAVHSSEPQADFIGTFFQPSGAGYTRSVSLGPDSRLGGQVRAKFGDKLSAIVQVIAQHQADDSYKPKIEWANLKYQLTPELSVRLGRIALPTVLLSETRLVSYANTWVRPSIEVYDGMPITSNDGVDASYRFSIGETKHSIQLFSGGSKVNLSGGDASAKYKNAWGVNDMIEYGSLSLRFGVVTGKLSFDIPGVNQLMAGLNQFAAGVSAVPLPAYQAASAQASALSIAYSPNDIKLSIFNVAATYDPGDWFVTAELFVAKATGLLARTDSWYVSGGYRLGSVTPYVTLASAKATKKTEPGISTAGLDPRSAAGAAALTAGINAVMDGFSQGTQDSVALGVRWDFMPNVSLKAQFDRVSLGRNAAGRFTNIQPGFVRGGKINITTVAVDFVF